MSATISSRKVRTVRIAGLSVVLAGAVAASGISLDAANRNGHSAKNGHSGTAAVAGASHHVSNNAAHPLTVGKKVTPSQLPDTPAQAKARGEQRATLGPKTASHRAPGKQSHLRTDVKASTTSTNWSGLVGTGGRGSFQGAIGDWYVPQVYVSGQNRYGCTWVGVDGWNGVQSLIQAGTEEDYINGKAYYYAWAEELPAAQNRIYLNGSLAPVKPGDLIYSYVYQTSAGVYRIYLNDATQNWYFDKSYYYNTPGTSVEWVQEATQVGGAVQKPTNFGAVGFGDIYVLQGGAWRNTALNNGNVVNLKQGSTVYTSVANPSNTNPQTFVDRYVGP